PLAGALGNVLREIEDDGRARNANRGLTERIVDVVIMPEIMETRVRAAIPPIGDHDKAASVEAPAGWEARNISRRLQSVARGARNRAKQQSAKHRRIADLLCSVAHKMELHSRRSSFRRTISHAGPRDVNRAAELPT